MTYKFAISSQVKSNQNYLFNIEHIIADTSIQLSYTYKALKDMIKIHRISHILFTIKKVQVAITHIYVKTSETMKLELIMIFFYKTCRLWVK